MVVVEQWNPGLKNVKNGTVDFLVQVERETQ